MAVTYNRHLRTTVRLEACRGTGRMRWEADLTAYGFTEEVESRLLSAVAELSAASLRHGCIDMAAWEWTAYSEAFPGG